MVTMDVYGVLAGVETAAKIAECNANSHKQVLRKLVTQISDGEQQLIETVSKRDTLINDMLVNPVSKSNWSALSSCEEQLRISTEAHKTLKVRSATLLDNSRKFYDDMKSLRRAAETELAECSMFVEKLREGKVSLALRKQQKQLFQQLLQPHVDKLDKAREDLSCFQAVQRNEKEREERLRRELEEILLPQFNRIGEEMETLISAKNAQERLLTEAQHAHNSLCSEITARAKSFKGELGFDTNEFEKAIEWVRCESKPNERIEHYIKILEHEADLVNKKPFPCPRDRIPNTDIIESIRSDLLSVIESSGNCDRSYLAALNQTKFDELLNTIKTIFKQKLSTATAEIKAADSAKTNQATRDAKAAMDRDVARKEQLLQEKKLLEEKLNMSI